MGAPLTPNSTCRTPNRRRSSSWRTASAPSGPSNCRRTPTGSSTAASPRCCSTTGGSATPRAPPAGRPVPPPGRPARSRRRRPDRTVGHVVRRRPRHRDGGETRRRRRPLAGPLRRRNRDADPPGARLGTRLSAHGDEHGLRDAVRGLLRLDPHTVPVVGPPATFAMLNTPGAEAEYRDSPGRERLGDLPSGAGGATGAALQADFACRRGRRAAVPHRCEGRPHRTTVGGRTARPAARPRRRLPRGAVRARRRGAGGLPGPAPTVRPASAPARPALRSAPRGRLSTAAAAPSMRRRRRRPARAAARTPG